VRTTCFWNILQQSRSNQHIWATNNLKVFGSETTKGTNQDSQKRQRSPMPGGGEP
jgi:hypothetical protein